MKEPSGVCKENDTMKNNVYAYIRVSSREQNETRQLDALAGFRIPEENIYLDKQSGKNFDRPAYQRMLKRLKLGDLLVLCSLDRLGRNYEEILEQWRYITRTKQSDVVVLDFPLLDTRVRGEGDLTGRFVADMVLQVLAYVAQKERENIHARQAEGIAAAKARGVRFGRPPAPLAEGFALYCGRWFRGEISAMAAARACDMPVSTFRSRALKYKNEGQGFL